MVRSEPLAVSTVSASSSSDNVPESEASGVVMVANSQPFASFPPETHSSLPSQTDTKLKTRDLL